MIYQHLFERAETGKTVTAAIIGAGEYATAIVTQARSIPRLEVSMVADVDLAAARGALASAGCADDEFATCDNRAAALRALEAGRKVVTQDAMLAMEMPVDVVAEATGVPEHGARHALEAIRHGKHVAMVNKEADVVVGPVLKAMADDAGLVYTAVDGDQHGLLMGLVFWARELGLEVLCGGKFRNAELTYDPAGRNLACHGEAIPLRGGEASLFEPIAPGQVDRVVRERLKVCAEHARVTASDLGEMAIAANATGLMPDVETLHRAVLRVTEIPEALCLREHGGLLARRGAVEEVVCLRHPWDAGTGGGCFVVVACDTDYSRETLVSKGLIPNSRNTAALIYRPYHLCGVETPMTILCAGLLGAPTGSADYQPRVDVVAQAAEDLRRNDILEDVDTEGIAASISPAQVVSEDSPLPLFMAVGKPLARDVPAGTLLTRSHFLPPRDSILWSLRAQQDQRFQPGAAR